jgi:hypothetical protein
VRATRVAAAVSIVLTVVFSVVAALGFSGHSTPKTSGASAGSRSERTTTTVRLALPPKGQGGTLTPPASLPIQNPHPGPPAVTSGGS